MIIPSAPRPTTSRHACHGRSRGTEDRRVYDADTIMARTTAARLLGHLAAAGFVVLRRSPDPAPAAPKAHGES